LPEFGIREVSSVIIIPNLSFPFFLNLDEDETFGPQGMDFRGKLY